MGKTNVTICISGDVFDEFQKLIGKGNVSPNLEEYMTTTLAVQKQDLKGIDLKIIENDLTKLNKKLIKIQAEIKQKSDIKEKIQADKIQEEQDKLEEEKIKIEKMNTCVVCGRQMGEEFKKMKMGEDAYMCNPCYSTMPPKDLRQMYEKYKHD